MLYTDAAADASQGTLRGYQAVVFVQDPMLAAALLAALVGRSASLGRRLRAESLLFALVGVAMPATAAATTMFDYRYVLPAIPPLCLAAGTAVTVARSRLAERRTMPKLPAASQHESQPVSVEMPLS